MAGKLIKNRQQLIIVFLVSFLFIVTISTLWNMAKKQKDIDRLKAEINANNMELKKMEKERLEILEKMSKMDDDKEIERIARDRLHMVKDGETVYRVEEEK